MHTEVQRSRVVRDQQAPSIFGVCLNSSHRVSRSNAQINGPEPLGLGKQQAPTPFLRGKSPPVPKPSHKRQHL